MTLETPVERHDRTTTASDAVLAVRGGGIGSVLVAEPALRALAADAPVTLLCSPSGRGAAEAVGAVGRVVTADLPWTSPGGGGVKSGDLLRVASSIRELGVGRAVIFTSQFESALPTAVLLRLAGVPYIAARSSDHAGALLDVRLSSDPPVHEVERHLELVEALGLPAPFDRRIRIEVGASPVEIPPASVVVHPGASSPARTPSPHFWREVVARLADDGRPVVLTGGRDDLAARSLRTAPGVTLDLVGRTSVAELAGVIATAEMLCIGHAGPLQIAAAVGTPVVTPFPSTAPVDRWRPWMVPHRVISDPSVSCAPCHRRRCPVPGQPCVTSEPADVVRAVAETAEEVTRAV